MVQTSPVEEEHHLIKVHDDDVKKDEHEKGYEVLLPDKPRYVAKSVDTPTDTLVPLQRLHHFFEQSCDRNPEAIALLCNNEALNYAELDKRANCLANYLRDEYQLHPGTTAAILMERSIDMYIALLSVLKCGATFVPIDPSVPQDRIKFVIDDSETSLIISHSALAELTADIKCNLVLLDEQAQALQQQPDSRPIVDGSSDALCYIIYTSGKIIEPAYGI